MVFFFFGDESDGSLESVKKSPQNTNPDAPWDGNIYLHERWKNGHIQGEM